MPFTPVFQLNWRASWSTLRVQTQTLAEYIGFFANFGTRDETGYAPNVPAAVVGRDVITPLDLERRFGITEGNIFHGDIRLDQLFFMRPCQAGRITKHRSTASTCAEPETKLP